MGNGHAPGFIDTVENAVLEFAGSYRKRRKPIVIQNLKETDADECRNSYGRLGASARADN